MARILIIGSGGREHALAWSLARENRHQLYCAPGNPGTAALGSNVALDSGDFQALARFARLQLLRARKLVRTNAVSEDEVQAKESAALAAQKKLEENRLVLALARAVAPAKEKRVQARLAVQV